MAGTKGNKSASPRLSPSAISAICCTAKAGSQVPRVEKIAPAMAVPEMERVAGFDAVRRVIGLFGVGFVSFGVVMHLALSMAMVVDSVAAIDDL